MSRFTATLQAFFTTYLTGQKAASPHTISAYRDTWRMLLTYLHDTTGTRPADIEVTDLNVDAITGFLQYLQTQRRNSARTRNARLAAIHSLFSYAAYRHPAHHDLDLSHRSRGRNPPQRARPGNADRPSRSRHPADVDHHWPACR